LAKKNGKKDDNVQKLANRLKIGGLSKSAAHAIAGAISGVGIGRGKGKGKNKKQGKKGKK
jgi:hypothetical protein